jgi:hypothetical protein
MDEGPPRVEESRGEEVTKGEGLPYSAILIKA